MATGSAVLCAELLGAGFLYAYRYHVIETLNGKPNLPGGSITNPFLRPLVLN